LLAMNDNAVRLWNRVTPIASKRCSCVCTANLAVLIVLNFASDV